MFTSLKKLTTIILGLALASQVQANLINNGSFESVGASSIGGHGTASTWQIYSDIPDWDASNTFEIWTNDFIVPAYDGDNVLELNAHPAVSGVDFSISQTFATKVGAQYELTFAGHRRDAGLNESFSVSAGDFSTSIANQVPGVWNEYSFLFTALDLSTTLTFKSLDHWSDTTGNVLDAVSVAAVPEPSLLAIFGAGLFATVFWRRKRIS